MNNINKNNKNNNKCDNETLINRNREITFGTKAIRKPSIGKKCEERSQEGINIYSQDSLIKLSPDTLSCNNKKNGSIYGNYKKK